MTNNILVSLLVSQIFWRQVPGMNQYKISEELWQITKKKKYKLISVFHTNSGGFIRPLNTRFWHLIYKI